VYGGVQVTVGHKVFSSFRDKPETPQLDANGLQFVRHHISADFLPEFKGDKEAAFREHIHLIFPLGKGCKREWPRVELNGLHIEADITDTELPKE
jgi:hypothetical protein